MLLLLCCCTSLHLQTCAQEEKWVAQPTLAAVVGQIGCNGSWPPLVTCAAFQMPYFSYLASSWPKSCSMRGLGAGRIG